jgi:hypothetical protein
VTWLDLARPGSTEKKPSGVFAVRISAKTLARRFYFSSAISREVCARARTLIAAVVVVVIVGDRSGAITSRWRREAADSAEGRKKRFDACRCARHQSSS